MAESFRSSAIFFTFLTMVQLASCKTTPASERACIPAEKKPSRSSSSCYPLPYFNRLACKNHGVIMPYYFYRTPKEPRFRDWYIRYVLNALDLYNTSRVISAIKKVFKNWDECKSTIALMLCRSQYPACDGTQSVFQKQKICQETCLDLFSKCGTTAYDLVKIWVKFNSPNFKIPLCEDQPLRNAGDSPECWHYNTGERSHGIDCLYENGSSYQGNISTTMSGISCQAWTEQCPHRHTMTTTYPELKEAKNYCRNPQNSGQRPWCFTTERSKRWEYCDIPKCPPVDGGYGNWSLKSTCNVTCGKGLERWTRECNNPETKYGGKSCDDIGESVQYRRCETVPCPVNGGYSNWTLNVTCNASCEGVEVWRRHCNNPRPKHGGRDCRELGESEEIRKCGKTSCRKVAVGWESQTTAITAGVIVCAIIIALLMLVFIRRRKKRKQDDKPYAQVKISHWQGSRDLERRAKCERGNETSRNEREMQEISENKNNAFYQNVRRRSSLNNRQVVHINKDYVNTRTTNKSWYDRLRLFQPKATDLFRNPRGVVDQFQRHVYDILLRAQEVFAPYAKPKIEGRETEKEKNENSGEDSLYDKLQRPADIVVM